MIIIISISIILIIKKAPRDRGLRPIILIGTPATERALRSARITTALAKFPAVTFLLAF